MAKVEALSLLIYLNRTGLICPLGRQLSWRKTALSQLLQSSDTVPTSVVTLTVITCHIHTTRKARVRSSRLPSWVK